MMMAGTHIDCCISYYALTKIIPNVNRSADAPPDYCVKTHVIKTSDDQIMLAATSSKEYESRACHSRIQYEQTSRKFAQLGLSVVTGEAMASTE
jgi:hypothetical protein